MSMTYYAVTDDPNELAHYGILGMKWGVRKDKPRHSGSGKRRSAAYKKAQSKLSSAMRNGIKKAEAHWKEYNSPKAKEARFMKKAMQKARTGTLKYGKLSDDQVRRVTERLALERNARQLGSTENPRFAKRLKIAVGQGVITGIGAGTGAYIEERFRGRGRTTAEIKRDKRMAKYESDQSVQKRKARNKANAEYYEEAAKRGYEPGLITRLGQTDSARAKQVRGWHERDAREEERTKRQQRINETYDRAYAQKKAEYNSAVRAARQDKLYGRKTNTNNNDNNNNTGNGQKNPQYPVAINVYSANGKIRSTTGATSAITFKNGRRYKGRA